MNERTVISGFLFSKDVELGRVPPSSGRAFRFIGMQVAPLSCPSRGDGRGVTG
jgi:hypothetical protein